MAKSSIHFKAIKSTSEAHNTRVQELDYVHSALSGTNRHWTAQDVLSRRKEIERHCKKVSNRKLQKNAEPIREAVVNLNQYHEIEDLQKLADKLREEFQIDCFQIHIHRDEGLERDGEIERINYHAHMIFDWQNKDTGKTIKLNRLQLSQIQSLVAETLDMKRGELKENSNTTRLEAVEYKVEQEELHLKKLEQKKNRVRKRIKILEAERGETSSSSKEAIREVFFNSSTILTKNSKEFEQFNENDLNRAISELESELESQQNALRDFK